MMSAHKKVPFDSKSLVFSLLGKMTIKKSPLLKRLVDVDGPLCSLSKQSKQECMHIFLFIKTFSFTNLLLSYQ
jgi:hypothetical protein